MVELFDVYFDCIEVVNGRVNVVCMLVLEKVRVLVEVVDGVIVCGEDLGLFVGLLVVVKDFVMIVGICMMFGLLIYVDFVLL